MWIAGLLWSGWIRYGLRYAAVVRAYAPLDSRCNRLEHYVQLTDGMIVCSRTIATLGDAHAVVFCSWFVVLAVQNKSFLCITRCQCATGTVKEVVG